MKLSYIIIAISLFFKIEPVVAQEGSSSSLIHALGRIHSEKKKKKKVEERNQFMYDDNHQEEKESVYWKVVTRENVKEITNVPDSLNTRFIFYCNNNIPDKAQNNEYYYREKIIVLYKVFEESLAANEN